MTSPRRILVDTSAWIEAMRTRGDEATRARVASAVASGLAVFCNPVRLELRVGIGERERSWLEKLEEKLETVATTEEVWNSAHDAAFRLRRQGLTIPALDLLIAATAKVHGLELLHRDAHFDAIAELETPAGEDPP